MPQPTSVRRCAFSLTELLVATAIVTLAMVLLLPALLLARETSRRSACAHHLKSIGEGLRNYHDTHGMFPIGCRKQGGFGPSWWVGILPYLGEGELYANFDMTSINNGWAVTNAHNGKNADGVRIGAMLCPASELPESRSVGGYDLTLPSYAGISGSTNEGGLTETRVNSCCVKSAGQISGGGVLIPNAAISLRDITDGAANTLCVGEISDWAIDSFGNKKQVSAGYPNGWMMGTSGTGTPPAFVDRTMNVPCWSLTTIKYAPGTRDFNLPGIGFGSSGNPNFGPNNPLLSAHPGGSQGLMVDGSVRFLNNDIELLLLRILATRDDGQGIPVP